MATIKSTLPDTMMNHGQVDASSLWTHLNGLYGTMGPSAIYQYFLKAVIFDLPMGAGPSPKIAELEK